MSGGFTIPANPPDADGLADKLGQLATATEWRRAALVYARVRVADRQGRPAKKVNSDLLTPDQYARLKIHGLRSKTTIRAYWRAWDDAIQDGIAKPVSLGDEVELPDEEWALYYPPEQCSRYPEPDEDDLYSPPDEDESDSVDSERVSRDLYDAAVADRRDAMTPLERERNSEAADVWAREAGDKIETALDEAVNDITGDQPKRDYEDIPSLAAGLGVMDKHADKALAVTHAITDFDATNPMTGHILTLIDQIRMKLDAIEQAVKGGLSDDELHKMLTDGQQ